MPRAAIFVFLTLTFIPLSAEGAITSVTVNTTRDYNNADGYTYAEITIHGSVARADGSTGPYSVPAVIIYPRHRRGNGVGVVDWLNSAYYHFFPPTSESGTFQFTLLSTGNYLFEQGYTYISIQWNKKVTGIFGPTAPDDGHPHNHLLYGSIDRSADAWEILLDAARLLKKPNVYPGSDGPAWVATVLSSGYSQGGAAQLELLARYPSRHEYVERVTRAAADLAARGYITDEDMKALIAAAEAEPLPCNPGDDDGNDFQGGTPCLQSPLATSR